MNRPSQVVILAEDLRTERFVRYFLKRLKYNERDLRAIQVPQGSAEQFVRQQYPKELRAMRQRRATTVLVVVVDADNYSVGQRLGQLAMALSKQSIPAPRDGECVVLLVPKRNIETWILNLVGNAVNETDEYKPRSGSQPAQRLEGDLRPAAERFYDLSRAGAALPETLVDSLRRAIPQAQRIPRA